MAQTCTNYCRYNQVEKQAQKAARTTELKMALIERFRDLRSSE